MKFSPERKNVVNMGRQREEIILSGYAPEEQAEIKRKKAVLSSICRFIGKDFDLDIELNMPGKGWHWDFQNNIVRIDPKAMLEDSMDKLRFVVAHEGGHRRVSRVDFIPKDVWTQPGFSSMMNAIEDPRMNNFLVDAYPKLRQYMQEDYKGDMEGYEADLAEYQVTGIRKAPRFFTAGAEYIKQWFRDTNGEKMEISDNLPEDVKEVVEKTLNAAQASWWIYPSKEEADNSESKIRDYAQKSYEINRDKVWPEFQKLVEADIEDQKAAEAIRKMIRDHKRNSASQKSEPIKIPEGLDATLDETDRKELQEILEIEANKRDEPNTESVNETKDESVEAEKPIRQEEMSESLRKKLKEHIESLPPETRDEIEARAMEIIKEIEKIINQILQGEFLKQEVEGLTESPQDAKESEPVEENTPEDQTPPKVDTSSMKEALEKMENNKTEYQKIRESVLPLIDKLEDDLREIFVKRRLNKWLSGHKSGRLIDIKRRIQEKAKQVPVMESRAWQKRELPNEKDYAFELVVDLSSSMKSKISETFKAIVVISEVLNRLSIDFEVTGFNSDYFVFKGFEEDLNDEKRQKLLQMLRSVRNTTDDGWALRQASESLGKQNRDEKFLITLSDGEPCPSLGHDGPEYDLDTVISDITKNTDQKLIGLGIGDDTEHVGEYYPNSLANISVEEMSEKLAKVFRDAIENYDQF